MVFAIRAIISLAAFRVRWAEHVLSAEDESTRCLFSRSRLMFSGALEITWRFMLPVVPAFSS